MGALFLSATLSSIVIGRYMDHYRNLRSTALAMAWFNIAGNLIYLIPVLNWFPIFGRFLCGIADGIKPAYQGELTRTYPSKELSVLVTKIQTLTIICHALAPVSPIIFKWVNFKLFGHEINQYNCVALFLAGCTLTYGVAAYFLLTDLTKNPGYHVYLKVNQELSVGSRKSVSICQFSGDNMKNTDISNEEVSKESLYSSNKPEAIAKKDHSLYPFTESEIIGKYDQAELLPVANKPEIVDLNPKPLTLTELLKNVDVLVPLYVIFLINIVYAQSELMINIVAVNLFHWSIQHLSILTITVVIIAVLTLKYIERFNTYIDAYYMLVLCTTGNALNLTIILPLAKECIGNDALRNVAIFMTQCFNILFSYPATAFTTVILSVVVDHHSRCSVLGLRQMAMKLACFFGYFSAAFLFIVIDKAYIILTLFCLSTSLVMLIRSRSFILKYKEL
eukprot:TCONS_00061147-protein